MNGVSPAHRPSSPTRHGSSPYWLRIAAYAFCAGVIYVVLAAMILAARILLELPVNL